MAKLFRTLHDGTRVDSGLDSRDLAPVRTSDFFYSGAVSPAGVSYLYLHANGSLPVIAGTSRVGAKWFGCVDNDVRR